MAVAAVSGSGLDYYPCNNEGNGENYILHCPRVDLPKTKASEILKAFRRNKGNADITSLFIYNVKDMTDEIMDEILDIVSPSIPKMWMLGLVRDQLTRIPPAVRNFTSLTHFSASLRSDHTVLPAGSLVFSWKIDSIIILSGHLETIEPGAFQGDFSTTDISLDYNYLTSFDEDVFRPILESKYSSGNSSYIHVQNNRIECNCKLSWLVRQNRHLLPHVKGNCVDEDGQKRFEDLYMVECP